MKIAQKCELTTDCFHEAIQCNGKNYLRLSQITVLFIFINCMNLRKLHYSFDVLASQLKSKQNNNTKIIQFSLVTQLCPTLCDPMDHSMPGLPVHHQLPKFTQTHVHWVGDAIQPSYPLSSPSPPAINLSQHRGLFKSVRWPKYWSFSFNISPFNEHSGLISFRMDWLDLLAVQGTLQSLLQHHSSKASILRPIALTRWTFVGKVTSLLFNMLSRLVITFKA